MLYYSTYTASKMSFVGLFADLGVPLGCLVWTDSLAAMGICSSHGPGKLRHIDTRTLWIQEKVGTKQIILKKKHGELNPADLASKHKIDQLVELFGCAFMSGRAKSAPSLPSKRRMRS